MTWEPAQPAAPAAVDAETATVRKIVAQLEAMPPDRARLLAGAAYIVTRAANADLDDHRRGDGPHREEPRRAHRGLRSRGRDRRRDRAPAGPPLRLDRGLPRHPGVQEGCQRRAAARGPACLLRGRGGRRRDHVAGERGPERDRRRSWTSSRPTSTPSAPSTASSSPSSGRCGPYRAADRTGRGRPPEPGAPRTRPPAVRCRQGSPSASTESANSTSPGRTRRETSATSSAS